MPREWRHIEQYEKEILNAMAEKMVKLGYENIMEFGRILDWKSEIVTD